MSEPIERRRLVNSCSFIGSGVVAAAAQSTPLICSMLLFRTGHACKRPRFFFEVENRISDKTSKWSLHRPVRLASR